LSHRGKKKPSDPIVVTKEESKIGNGPQASGIVVGNLVWSSVSAASFFSFLPRRLLAIMKVGSSIPFVSHLDHCPAFW